MAPVMSMPPMPPPRALSNVLIITKIPEGVAENIIVGAVGRPTDVVKVSYRPADMDGLGWAFVACAGPHIAMGARERLNGKPLPGGPPSCLVEAANGEGLYGELRRIDEANSPWKETRTKEGQVYYYHVLNRQVSWTKPPPDFNPAPPLPPPAPAGRPGVGPMGRPMPGFVPPPPGVNQPPPPPSSDSRGPKSSGTSGPVGANLFVYHIPNSWSDDILRQHFEHYGGIISCRVQKDAEGRPRGFGFVSFDSPTAAGAAIVGMHSFPVEGKFLKVQLKKGDEQQLEQPSADGGRPRPY